MADEEQAPPKVGSEVFADEIRAGDERKVAAEKEEVTPPKVGPEIFSQPQPLDPNAGKPVDNPVGSEVFSEVQLKGIVPDPIIATGGEATPAAEKHADELGVDLDTVAGTGTDGKITKADVAEAFVPPATPAAAAHADALGVDLKQVQGTGKDGVITKTDVADHAAGA